MMPKKSKEKDGLPFAKILKQIMDERSLTVRAVAEMAKTSPTNIQNWLTGVAPTDLAAVERLATALGVGFKSLLLGKPETTAHQPSLSDLFEENEFFEGICKVSIKRLIPKKEGDK